MPQNDHFLLFYPLIYLSFIFVQYLHVDTDITENVLFKPNFLHWFYGISLLNVILKNIFCLLRTSHRKYKDVITLHIVCWIQYSSGVSRQKHRPSCSIFHAAFDLLLSSAAEKKENATRTVTQCNMHFFICDYWRTQKHKNKSPPPPPPHPLKKKN